jgi:hypothetical protein
LVRRGKLIVTTRRLFANLLLAGAFIAALAANTGARADVVYDFVAQGEPVGQYGPVALNVGFELTLHDGFMPEALDRQCYQNGCLGSGDFSTFTLSADIAGYSAELGIPSDRFGEADIGYINASSGYLTWDTATQNNITFSFGNGVWTATVDNDEIAAACGHPGCAASGTFSEVPEPASFGILAVGMIGCAAARRRRVGSAHHLRRL